MKITQFKEDDIITRSEPILSGDRSYQGDKMLFVGCESGMIVLIKLEDFDEGEIRKLEMDWWSDGWDYFPQNLIEKAISKIKKIAKFQNA